MKTKKQVFNPYLPSYEYIPDGEPHVFGDRVYVYGSHDRFNGKKFCLNDYVCYSVNIETLTEWKYEGVIYKKTQDPRNKNGEHAMWAPDVTKGKDGRYYLYYCLDVLPQIAVAVCDTPAGEYEFLDLVRYKDNTPLGEKDEDYIQFDPGIFIDEDGSIYLYSGNAPLRREDIGKEHKHSQVMELEDDMVTLKTEPKLLLPSIGESDNTGYEGHEFFEASSIRKIGNKYYFVYSSVNMHELCYAISNKPDSGYRYGGTIISHADIFSGDSLDAAVNIFGNNHGGIEKINGKWYVFYHRQTNRSHFSRQGCAEQIQILKDGSIPQVQVTSCGLNEGPLIGVGEYFAYTACHLTGKKGATFSILDRMKDEYPYFTQDAPDYDPSEDKEKPLQYIKNMKDDSLAGFKYFIIEELSSITVTVRGNGKGTLQIMTKKDKDKIGEIKIEPSDEWTQFSGKVDCDKGVLPLYFKYKGTGSIDFKKFNLKIN